MLLKLSYLNLELQWNYPLFPLHPVAKSTGLGRKNIGIKASGDSLWLGLVLLRKILHPDVALMGGVVFLEFHTVSS